MIKKDEVIKDEVIIDVKREEPNEFIFVEPFLGLPFTSTVRKVRGDIFELEGIYAENDRVSLHVLYQLLGLPDISITREFGWSEYLGSELGYNRINIGLKKVGNRYFLCYENEPMLGFAK